MDRVSAARGRVRRTLLGPFALAVLLLVAWSGSADAAATFTVNRTGDAADRRLGDDACDASRERGKQCTLRAAIQEANDTSGPDAIHFNIRSKKSVKTISPAPPLPAITEAVTIDGYTQRGARPNSEARGNDAVIKVQLSGSQAGQGATAVTINAADTTVRGLAINRFNGGGEAPAVLIDGVGATGNKIEGNFVGTDTFGTVALPNTYVGVDIRGGASDNVVGGERPDQRNLISGNGHWGVLIGRAGSATSGNRVEGNYIGTKRGGNEPLGNEYIGVHLNSTGNTVGGAAEGAGNVISGNGFTGLVVAGSGTRVEGNLIGTNAAGTAALGNAAGGVQVAGDDSVIGGTAAGAGNVISGNEDEGVSFGSLTDGNRVEGNTIFGNDSHGVRSAGNASGIAIGGATPEAGNRIFDNGDAGVRVLDGSGRSILSNDIFSNGGRGIDLGSTGVTPNDTDDPDTGANNLQNFPVITGATRNPNTSVTTVTGTLNSRPGQAHTIQCFLTEAGGDPSGHGEGRELLDTTTTATGVDGDSPPFTCADTGLAIGDNVSATATNTATGDTSEFARNVAVAAGP